MLQNVIMVGGLAGSAYIYTQLEIWATELGMNISRPDGPTQVSCSPLFARSTGNLHNP
jgi:hypothetical protein